MHSSSIRSSLSWKAVSASRGWRMRKLSSTRSSQDPLHRPRLPLEAIVSENRYRECGSDTLDAYNRELAAYYQARSGLDLDWRGQIARTLAQPLRPHILPFLQARGFAKK